MNVTLFAEPVFRLGTFTITNAFVNAFVLMIVFVGIGIWFRKRWSLRPGSFQILLEDVLEALLGYFDQVTGSREKSKKFLPLIGSFFLFILFSNWMGQLPGTGSIGLWENEGGTSVFVPLFRPATSDLNFTLGIALVAVITSHIIGMTINGFFPHWNKFFQFGGIWNAIKTLKPINILVSLVEFVVGLIEFVSEIAKVLSLSLRLFGNIFAGEVLMTVIASIFAYGLPLPFMALELIVGVVQAAVFSMLSLVYLTILSDKPHGSEEGGHEAHASA